MKEIEKSRKNIDEIDQQILSLLNQRMDISEQIGIYKEKNHLALNDSERESDIVQTLIKSADTAALKEHIEMIYSCIFDASRKWQKLQMTKECPFTKVGILGLGLLGGSIAKALKNKSPSTVICALARCDLDQLLARESGLLDQTFTTLEEMAREVDLIVIASPLSTVMSIAEEIASVTRARTQKLFVIDIGSVKTEIAKLFESLCSTKVEFIGTHPMAGSEKQGFANSKTTLFVERPWIITPHKNNTESCLKQIQTLITFLGADPIVLDANIHDEYAALISHVPYIVSHSYLEFIEKNHPDSTKIKGPGFSSFTRLGKDNALLHKEIQSMNPRWIQRSIEEWISFFQTSQEGMRPC